MRDGPLGSGGRACGGLSWRGGRGAALESATLVLGEAAPDARVLTGLDGPLEARVHDVATTAHSLGLVDLEDRRTRVADREEQLGVFIKAGCAVTPIHGIS